MGALAAASDWASTPSGYFTSVGITLMSAVGWFAIRRQSKVNDTQNAALQQATRALDVLVSQQADTKATTTDHSGRVRDLELSTAVLKDRLDRHEQWAAQTRQEFHPVPGPRPRR